MKNACIQKFEKILSEKETFLLTSHIDPDGDGTYVKVPCLDCSPILYVADNENPSKIFKKYQP